jgi:hypothetical protein
VAVLLLLLLLVLWERRMAAGLMSGTQILQLV